jgi:uncharacterized protein YbcV (DUF1398 family)
MDTLQIALAQSTLDGAESGQMNFGQIVTALSEAGFDGYLVDYRRNIATYYLPDGDNVGLDMDITPAEVATVFRPDAMKAAVREAQTNAPGYSYRGFCEKAKAAGCAGYLVSLSGRRVLYFGRSGETHTEHMPPAD